MIRTIIFAVFVVPVISLVLDKTQKRLKKKNSQILFLYHTPIKQYVMFVH